MKRCLLKTGQIFKPVKKEDWAAVAAIIGMYGMMGMMGITCPILFAGGTYYGQRSFPNLAKKRFN